LRIVLAGTPLDEPFEPLRRCGLNGKRPPPFNAAGEPVDLLLCGLVHACASRRNAIPLHGADRARALAMVVGWEALISRRDVCAVSAAEGGSAISKSRS
jgi:hypothetical protein